MRTVTLEEANFNLVEQLAPDKVVLSDESGETALFATKGNKRDFGVVIEGRTYFPAGPWPPSDWDGVG